MNYRKRVDGKRSGSGSLHSEIKAALEAQGWFVCDTSGAGRGFPDLVLAKHGRLVLAEIKNPKQPPSKRALKPNQVELHAKFALAGVSICVLMSVEEALKL